VQRGRPIWHNNDGVLVVEAVEELGVVTHRVLPEETTELRRDHVVEAEAVVVGHIVERRPGKYRIEHDASRHNDRTMGIALAARDLLNTPPPKMVKVIV